MISRFVRLSALALALLPAAALSTLHAQSQQDQTQPLTKTEQWQQDLATWRAQREQQVSAPDGWLTLAGLQWLKPGFNSVGSAADNNLHLPSTAPDHLGLLTVSGKTVQLLSPTGGFPADLKIDGNPAREGSLRSGPCLHRLRPLCHQHQEPPSVRSPPVGSPAPARTGCTGADRRSPRPAFAPW